MNINKENEEFFLNLVKIGKLSVSNSGIVINNKTGKELGKRTKEGFYKSIAMKDGRKLRHQLVHRLVHILYNDGFTKEQPICNHKDGNKTNNHYSNLERNSFSENNAHAWKTSLREYTESDMDSRKKLSGEKNPVAVLTQEQAEEIRRKYATGSYSQRALGIEYSVQHTTIGDITRGESYK